MSSSWSSTFLIPEILWNISDFLYPYEKLKFTLVSKGYKRLIDQLAPKRFHPFELNDTEWNIHCARYFSHHSSGGSVDLQEKFRNLKRHSKKTLLYFMIYQSFIAQLYENDTYSKPFSLKKQWCRDSVLMKRLINLRQLMLSSNDKKFLSLDFAYFVPFVVGSRYSLINELRLDNCDMTFDGVLNLCSGFMWRREIIPIDFYYDSPLKILDLGSNILIQDECINNLLATIGTHCPYLEELNLSDTSITDTTCGLLSIFYQSFFLIKPPFQNNNDKNRIGDTLMNRKMGRLCDPQGTVRLRGVVLNFNGGITAKGIGLLDQLYKTNVIPDGWDVVFYVRDCAYEYRDRPESSGGEEWDTRILEIDRF